MARASAFSPANVKLAFKGLFLVSVPTLFIAIFVSSIFFVIESSNREIDRNIRRRQAAELAARLASQSFNAVESVVTYAITGNQALAENCASIANEAPLLFAELQSLVKDEPGITELIDKARAAESKEMQHVEQIRQMIDTGQFEAEQAEDHSNINRALQLQAAIKPQILQAKESLADMKRISNELNQLSVIDSVTSARSRRALRIMLIFALAAHLLMPLALSRYFARSVTKRLSVMNDNTMRIAFNKPLLPPIEGTDEIAALDKQIHRMAESLKDSRKRERAILDNAVDVICSLDRSYTISAISQAVSKAWGYSQEELTGESILSLVALPEREQMMQTLQSAFERPGRHVFENRLIKKEGEPIDLSWSLFSSQLEQTLFCVAHNITERKQADQLIKESEQRSRRIMDLMPVGLLVVDATGSITYVNQTFQTMTGFADDEIIGTLVSEILMNQTELDRQIQDARVKEPHSPPQASGIPPQQSDKLEDHNHAENMLAFLQVISQESPAERVEVTVQKKTASFPAELSGCLIKTGDQISYLVALVDITEKQEVERLKQDFVSMLSHDLRTPLSSLQETVTHLQAGAYGQIGDRGKEILAKADRELGRLVRLIGDLLNLEEMKAGQFNLARCDASLGDIVSTSLEAIRRLAEMRRIDLDCTEIEDLVCYCDSRRIVQVLVNLLSNAIKFSPHESSIKLSVKENTENIKISIQDHGRGIPEQFQQQIFEKFTQLKDGNSSKQQGTGLGLPICKVIVELHGGEVGVESREGEGSTFWFTLPKTVASGERRIEPHPV